MLRMSSFALGLALLAGSLVVTGQEQPIFKSNVRTVPIYATVVDPSGRLVPDLEQQRPGLGRERSGHDVVVHLVTVRP